MRTAILYSLFALLATAVNIITQFIIYRIVDSHQILASIAAGTVTGLLTKYVLDRNYIFRSEREQLCREGARFARYAATGVLTTLIFWGVEIGAHVATGSEILRYMGGVAGLALGYWLKFHLDRQHVFNQSRRLSPSSGP